MKPDKRLEKIKHFLDHMCLPTLEAKGHDYTKGASVEEHDANANFKHGAQLLSGRDIDKYDVWFIYWLKHFEALLTWLNDRRVRSESIESRIVDLVNYLLILYTMLEEDKDVPRRKTITLAGELDKGPVIIGQPEVKDNVMLVMVAVRPGAFEQFADNMKISMSSKSKQGVTNGKWKQ